LTLITLNILFNSKGFPR